MIGTFRLEIHLGNDAMQTDEDVAGALEMVKRSVLTWGLRHTSTNIMDLNGNTVGSFITADDNQDVLSLHMERRNATR